VLLCVASTRDDALPYEFVVALSPPIRIINIIDQPTNQTTTNKLKPTKASKRAINSSSRDRNAVSAIANASSRRSTAFSRSLIACALKQQHSISKFIDFYYQ
jgi:hypothetical protein